MCKLADVDFVTLSNTVILHCNSNIYCLMCLEPNFLHFLLNLHITQRISKRKYIAFILSRRYLTHRLLELFCSKCIFEYLRDLKAGCGPNWLQSIQKKHLQHDIMPFFPLASHFRTFLLGYAQKSKFWYFGGESDIGSTSLGFSIF